MTAHRGVAARTTIATPRTSAWISPLVLAAVAIACALPAILYGPAIRERAQHLRAQQIDRENRTVCAKLRAPLGSQGFARCVEALDDVRRRQGEWLAAETAGLL
jgi:hypothetical protein